MLCFFGFQYDPTAPSSKHHAEQALDCAIQIQKRAVERCLHGDPKLPAYPLRIGLNTGDVYIGDLGGKKKIEFTVIGHSVNFAQRLENACDIYRVLCGRATWDLLPHRRAASSAFLKKQIPVKHQEEMGAYEFNPFAEEPDKLTQALSKYRSMAGLVRTEERYLADSTRSLKIVTSFGHGLLLDYSRSGLSIQLDNYFGKGTPLNISFVSKDPKAQEIAERDGLALLSGTVRWGHQNSAGYRHGILFGGLSEEKKDKLLDFLRNHH